MKQWYVVHVYSGYEAAVKEDLLKRAAVEGLSDELEEVLVPAVEADAQGGVESEQLMPGYLLIKAEMTPEIYSLVITSPRVMRFLGGRVPSEVPVEQVDKIKKQVSGEVSIVAKESEFVVGSEVSIEDGPFAGFVGVIDRVDDESEKLVVMVSIFGRMTPVELSFEQVKV